MIPYSKQNIHKDDIDAVRQVLESAFLTQGPKVQEFEAALARYCKVKHCVAVCNATAALHLACKALGVQHGDLVITTPLSFVASANCALYCGAKVDFVDIDSRTWTIDPVKLRLQLQSIYDDGGRVKALVVVHFAGLSCDMQAIYEIAHSYGIYVIEDASHALGATYMGEPVGGCRYSDMAIFSFHPVKMITTGEGGAIVTNNAELDEKLRLLACHGLVRDREQFQDFDEVGWFGPWAYQQVALGYNYRITDIQCALGITQLQKLDSWVAERNRLAGVYRQNLAQSPVQVQEVPSFAESSYHLFVIRLPGHLNRHEVYNKLRANGYGVNIHYIPIHTQPFFQALGFSLGDFPVVEDYYRHALSLPLFPGLDDQIVFDICQVLTG